MIRSYVLGNEAYENRKGITHIELRNSPSQYENIGFIGKEFDTYKIGTTANSTSTMHKIHAKEFILDDFSHEHLSHQTTEVLRTVIDDLNDNRSLYLKTKSKGDWWQMIQLLPSSYNQTRTVTMTYENLLNMYRQRRNHKLDEWRIGFCKWVESLPYAKELIMYTGENE